VKKALVIAVSILAVASHVATAASDLRHIYITCSGTVVDPNNKNLELIAISNSVFSSARDKYTLESGFLRHLESKQSRFVSNGCYVWEFDTRFEAYDGRREDIRRSQANGHRVIRTQFDD